MLRYILLLSAPTWRVSNPCGSLIEQVMLWELPLASPSHSGNSFEAIGRSGRQYISLCLFQRSNERLVAQAATASEASNVIRYRSAFIQVHPPACACLSELQVPVETFTPPYYPTVGYTVRRFVIIPQQKLCCFHQPQPQPRKL